MPEGVERKMASVADRVQKHNESLKAQGGRIIHKLRLKPEAAAALACLEAEDGRSATQIINELLIKNTGC
ncbi:hypothetical protein SAMN05660443_0235 [Marinospirillum celere]|uniref:Uncharacterized protein n=1 Tax=Marinospirillum celere TaxID=1122252 RepID=A0A1I1DZI4_9GAMM|nr:hypothetical protein SAMN05660443_0235 [Marinospirillum celere]